MGVKACFAGALLVLGLPPQPPSAIRPRRCPGAPARRGRDFKAAHVRQPDVQAVLLAGCAAEKLVVGHLSTGAANDLARASDMAPEMVTRFGMDESLGPVAFGRQRSPWISAPEICTELDVSEATRLRIDEAVQRILVNAFEQASRALMRNRPVLERTAQALLEKETLEEADLDRFAADLESGPSADGGESSGQETALQA